MSSYYKFLSRTTDEQGTVIAEYQPNLPCQGAWNEHEQHMAPASGLMSYELELFEPRDDMVYGRLSFDILGLIPFKNFTITTRNIRPGKTIELIEVSLSCEGKAAIVGRAWRMMKNDTAMVASIEDEPIMPRDEMIKWPELTGVWGGGYINSLKEHSRTSQQRRQGNAQVWISNDLEMVEGIETSSFVKLIGMVDTSNGVAVAQSSPFSHMFPNVDLQIHLYRLPKGKWLGLSTRQQYGNSGVGLTSSTLYDEEGPFGHSEQILTVRPMPK
ncbi:MAG: thioesterase family protein [Alcaligenaceae bacterium]|nr:thioesterase family protein [Alcaligenaceae bacterium]